MNYDTEFVLVKNVILSFKGYLTDLQVFALKFFHAFTIHILIKIIKHFVFDTFEFTIYNICNFFRIWGFRTTIGFKLLRKKKKWLLTNFYKCSYYVRVHFFVFN